MVYMQITSCGTYFMFPIDVVNRIGKSLNEVLFVDVYFFDSSALL
jgi:hypothetical protein